MRKKMKYSDMIEKKNNNKKESEKKRQVTGDRNLFLTLLKIFFFN
jgi:hypothetical protein